MTPKISVIVNTACLDPSPGSNPHRSAAYAERQRLLEEEVLPSILGRFDEIIVAGIYKPGGGYQYVEVPPYERSRVDALIQREQGARHATGDILIFCHDDHALGKGFRDQLLSEPEPWDLVIPKRRHAKTGATLNNGRDENYMGGHALAMKRWLWAEVPWTSVSTEFWDTTMTRLWREAGATLRWSENLIHLDVEATEEEA